MIEEVHESQNNIILFVSHNMADVAALSDKVLVMDEGKLIMAGTPKEIFAQRDRLAAIGLSVPPVTELMYRLKERGIPAAENILDIKEAAEVLYEYLQRKS